MARDDDLWAAPGADTPVTAPAGPYPRYPDEAVWLTDPWGQARAAALEAWLERRFPEAGSAEQRDRRGRRRARVLLTLGAAVLVALVVALVVNRVPEPRDPGAFPWLLAALGGFAVLWAALAVAVLVAVRHRPDVSTAEREVVERLTTGECRRLRAEMRSPASPDAEQLDVVAAAWLARRWHVIESPARLLPPLLWLVTWQVGWWSLLAAALAVVLLVDTVDGVRDLLAARDRVRAADPAAVAR